MECVFTCIHKLFHAFYFLQQPPRPSLSNNNMFMQAESTGVDYTLTLTGPLEVTLRHLGPAEPAEFDPALIVLLPLPYQVSNMIFV